MASQCKPARLSRDKVVIACAETRWIARGMNVLAQECYFVKRYDNVKGKEVWAVQAAIDSFRIRAEKTGLYDGQDEPEFEHDEQGRVTLARVRVYRKDWSRPMVGVARWTEYVQTKKDGSPTKFWAQMPYNQLAKCAEALALRKAFPSALAKIYTTEEMGQADNDPGPMPPRGPLKSPPQLETQLSASVDLLSEAVELNARMSAATTKGEVLQLWAAANELKRRGLPASAFAALQALKDKRKGEFTEAAE